MKVDKNAWEWVGVDESGWELMRVDKSEWRLVAVVSSEWGEVGGNESGSEWLRVGVTMVLKCLCSQLSVNFVRVDVAHGWVAAGGGNFWDG